MQREERHIYNGFQSHQSRGNVMIQEVLSNMYLLFTSTQLKVALLPKQYTLWVIVAIRSFISFLIITHRHQKAFCRRT